MSLAREVLLPADVEAALRGGRFSGPVHCYGRVTSTNTVALALGRDGSPEGTLVIAEEQTAGRGRFRRQWHSPAGLGLWFSIILRPPLDAGANAPVSIVASLAVAEAVRRETGMEPRVKWPNDVWLEGRKLAGILAEMSAVPGGPGFLVVGVGVNVNQEPADFPAEIRQTAMSLRIATGRVQARAPLLGGIVRSLESRYQRFLASGLTPFIPEWNAFALWMGEPVRLTAGERVIRGIHGELAPSGGLRLRTRDGIEEVVVAGDLERDPA